MATIIINIPYKLPYLVAFEDLVSQRITRLVHKRTDFWATHTDLEKDQKICISKNPPKSFFCPLKF